MGEVVIADNTATGEGVGLSERVEHLAKQRGLCVKGTINDVLSTQLPFD